MVEKHTQCINTNKPRESCVVAVGDTVKKTPLATRPEHIKQWLIKQRFAQDAVNALLSTSSRVGGYFVPKIIKINSSATEPYVIEQLAKGHALSKEFFDGLSPEQQENIYRSLAAFVYDMGHSRPILTLKDKLDDGDTFLAIVGQIQSYLDERDYSTINNAYKFFVSSQGMLSPLVFFHGDMNEDNMFYDPKTDTVSFLDFAEATYETMDYIFNQDLKKLPWLNAEKLSAYYLELTKKESINIKSNPVVLTLYNALRSLRWTGENIIAGKYTNNRIIKILLQEQIDNVRKAYSNVIAQFSQKTKTL